MHWPTLHIRFATKQYSFCKTTCIQTTICEALYVVAYTWLQFPSCMNLFVLSGLLTNIPIGFFLLFPRYYVAWEREREREQVVESMSVRDRCVLLSPFSCFRFYYFGYSLIYFVNLIWSIPSTKQTIGTFHIIFPALCLLSFSFCYRIKYIHK